MARTKTLLVSYCRCTLFEQTHWQTVRTSKLIRVCVCVHRFHRVQNGKLVSGCKMHIFQTIFANACTAAIVLANKNIQLQSATHHKLKFRKNPSAPDIPRLWVSKDYALELVSRTTIFVTNAVFVGAIRSDDNVFSPTEYGITSKKCNWMVWVWSAKWRVQHTQR